MRANSSAKTRASVRLMSSGFSSQTIRVRNCLPCRSLASRPKLAHGAAVSGASHSRPLQNAGGAQDTRAASASDRLGRDRDDRMLALRKFGDQRSRYWRVKPRLPAPPHALGFIDDAIHGRASRSKTARHASRARDSPVPAAAVIHDNLRPALVWRRRWRATLARRRRGGGRNDPPGADKGGLDSLYGGVVAVLFGLLQTGWAARG
jgi:hypothetical protein